MSTLVENPFLQQEALPKFASIQPADLTPAVTELLAKMERDFVDLESALDAMESPEYDQVLPQVERMQFPIGYVWGVAGHLKGVKDNDALRAAYEENQPKVIESLTKFSQSKSLYNSLETLVQKLDGNDFETSQKRRAVDGSLQSMKLGGVGLEGEQKEKFNAMKMRLAELSTSFSNNVLDATKAFSLTIDDPSKLAGVPASAKSMWANSHVQAVAKEGEEPPAMDPEKGPYRITLDAPSYIAVLSHLPDRALRERVYKASITRASESSADKNNVPIVYEILKLKNDMARLLGFKNYAEQSLSRKMAPSVEAVRELSDLIAAKALPAAIRELEEITALARASGGEEYSEANLEKLMPWDTTFWSERLKESKFDMTAEQLRPYFALPNVLDGMFGLVTRIFNIEVRAADGEAEVWNKDVRFFNVYDLDSEKHIASFFLDPYSRPEDKRGGAWMDVCIGKSEAVRREIPVAYLTCNGSPPVGDTPSLMTFGEVSILFYVLYREHL
jgi:oligopeptidase A